MILKGLLGQTASYSGHVGHSGLLGQILAGKILGGGPEIIPIITHTKQYGETMNQALPNTFQGSKDLKHP